MGRCHDAGAPEEVRVGIARTASNRPKKMQKTDKPLQPFPITKKKHQVKDVCFQGPGPPKSEHRDDCCGSRNEKMEEEQAGPRARKVYEGQVMRFLGVLRSLRLVD